MLSKSSLCSTKDGLARDCAPTSCGLLFSLQYRSMPKNCGIFFIINEGIFCSNDKKITAKNVVNLFFKDSFHLIFNNFFSLSYIFILGKNFLLTFFCCQYEFLVLRGKCSCEAQDVFHEKFLFLKGKYF